jgi:hypothetical protein
MSSIGVVSSLSLHFGANPHLSVIPLSCSRKDAKKVSKLEAQIPYHEGRGDKEAAEKIRQQIDDIWTKTKEAALAM